MSDSASVMGAGDVGLGGVGVGGMGGGGAVGVVTAGGGGGSKVHGEFCHFGRWHHRQDGDIEARRP